MNMKKISRRGMVLSGLALMASGCMSSRRAMKLPDINAFTLDPRLQRQRVAYQSIEAPGSIVVNTSERFLYYVEGDGWATRYGVAVGEEGLPLVEREGLPRLGIHVSEADVSHGRPINFFANCVVILSGAKDLACRASF